MDKIIISGGVKLQGNINISGSKNAALPLMISALLTDQEIVLHNCPRLSDIMSLEKLLNHHGVRSNFSDNTIKLSANNIENCIAPYDLVRKMRASVLVLGPLLARKKQAQVSLPGGCAIGTRPIDLHLMGLQKMGAVISLQKGYITAKAPIEGLHGHEITLPQISVGATENILMAATLAKGTTKLINAAVEPEITDLANLLVSMGAKIEGIGSSTLTIHGVAKLHGAEHTVIADRIEAGSYAIAAAITKGSIELQGANAGLLPNFIDALKQSGIDIQEKHNSVIVTATNKIKPVDVTTAPFPKFPTDLQAQFMTLMCLSDGLSTINENIFENRFMHVPELKRMGANISLQGNTAYVRGIPQFNSAEVMATDLRASFSLILAALAAQGATTINRIYHLDRGYESIEKKLSNCGAQIHRVSGNNA